MSLRGQLVGPCAAQKQKGVGLNPKEARAAQKKSRTQSAIMARSIGKKVSYEFLNSEGDRTKDEGYVVHWTYLTLIVTDSPVSHECVEASTRAIRTRDLVQGSVQVVSRARTSSAARWRAAVCDAVTAVTDLCVGDSSAGRVQPLDPLYAVTDDDDDINETA